MNYEITQEELEQKSEEYIKKLDGCIRYIIKHSPLLNLKNTDIVWADEMRFSNDIIIFTKKNIIQYTCPSSTVVEVNDNDYLKREWMLQYTKGLNAMKKIEKRENKNIFKKIFGL